jgi:hypothetical protein
MYYVFEKPYQIYISKIPFKAKTIITPAVSNLTGQHLAGFSSTTTYPVQGEYNAVTLFASDQITQPFFKYEISYDLTPSISLTWPHRKGANAFAKFNPDDINNLEMQNGYRLLRLGKYYYLDDLVHQEIADAWPAFWKFLEK